MGAEEVEDMRQIMCNGRKRIQLLEDQINRMIASEQCYVCLAGDLKLSECVVLGCGHVVHSECVRRGVGAALRMIESSIANNTVYNANLSVLFCEECGMCRRRVDVLIDAAPLYELLASFERVFGSAETWNVRATEFWRRMNKMRVETECIFRRMVKIHSFIQLKGQNHQVK